MSKIYRRVLITCITVAVVVGSAYGALFVAAAIEGPGSDLVIPLRLNNIILLGIGVATLVAAQLWVTHVAVSSSDERVAAAVTVAVVGQLESRMVKVAERTSASSGEQLVDAVQRIAEAVGAGVADRVERHADQWMSRVHTEGMMFEAEARARESTSAGATVSSLLARRGE